jgi:hypothetical protein
MDSQECPCPSCGFYTIGEAFFGSYDICPLCGWEDDGLQLANSACGGGANRGSLIEYQRESLEILPIELQEHGLYKRDSKWRPLNREEIELAENEKNEKYWKNKAVYGYSEAYWVKGQ